MTKLNLLIFTIIFGSILSFITFLGINVYEEKSDKARGYTDIYITRYFEYDSDKLLPQHQVAHEVEGSCHYSSQVNPRPDAFACTANGAVYDPCFVDNKLTSHSKLACPKTPWESGLTVINLKGDLPSPNKQVNFFEAKPWAVELEGHIKCLVTTYNQNSFGHSLAGLESHSLCTGHYSNKSEIKLFSKIDRSKPFWLTILDEDKHQRLTTKRINVAYY
jgi:hypothetical protein